MERHAPATSLQVPAQSAVSSADTEQALFTLRHVFDLLASASPAQDRATLRQWAQHVATAAPVDGQTTHRGARDWRGARDRLARFLGGGALRETMQVLGDSLTKLLAHTRAGDQRTARELQRLRDVAMHGSFDELKLCAAQTIDSVGVVLAEREHAAQEQLRVLHERTGGLQERLSEAEREKNTDALTQLANRGAFDAEMRRAAEVHLLVGEASAIVLVDLDHFKLINDEHGHLAGDAVLRAVSRCLAMTFPRRADCVARYGGEELAVILRGTTIVDAAKLAERALANIRALSVDAGVFLRVTASAGVAPIGDDANDAVGRADAALYRAKRAGRDRVCVDSQTRDPQ